jgi:hypothetical protein
MARRAGIRIRNRRCESGCGGAEVVAEEAGTSAVFDVGSALDDVEETSAEHGGREGVGSAEELGLCEDFDLIGGGFQGEEFAVFAEAEKDAGDIGGEEVGAAEAELLIAPFFGTRGGIEADEGGAGVGRAVESIEVIIEEDGCGELAAKAGRFPDERGLVVGVEAEKGTAVGIGFGDEDLIFADKDG